MVRLRPFGSIAELVEASDRVWRGLGVEDWDEAFRSHPRIGERKAPAAATKRSASWSRREQDGVHAQDATVLGELARRNAEYEARFGRVFLVCATGKSAAEMLAILRRRLLNDEETELREAVEQQRQITLLRLRKWLSA
jgi:OHCU decarboxylase